MAKRRKRDRSDSVSDVEPAVAEPAVVEPAKPDRQDKKESRTDRRSDLLDAKAQLQSAKSQKWKWVFFTIAAGLAAYMVLSSGGVSGIMNLFKGK